VFSFCFLYSMDAKGIIRALSTGVKGFLVET